MLLHEPLHEFVYDAIVLDEFGVGLAVERCGVEDKGREMVYFAGAGRAGRFGLRVAHAGSIASTDVSLAQMVVDAMYKMQAGMRG